MSVRYQCKLNLKLKEELDCILSEINRQRQYFHKYWYSLKYFTASMHGVYRLLNRLLVLHGNEATGKKSPYHSLLYGPHTMATNCHILEHLINYVSIQIAWIHAIAVFDGNLKIQKRITFVFMRVIKFFDHILYFDDITTEYTMNGLPIKLNFI